jgi:hypothetical protein
MKFLQSLTLAAVLGGSAAVVAPVGTRAESGSSEAPKLARSEPITLSPSGGHGATVAVDPRNGAVYLAWAQKAPKAPNDVEDREKRKKDVSLSVLVARSDDGGRRFGAPVAASRPGDHVRAYTVSPARVAVGPQGDVYVQYGDEDPDFSLEGSYLGRMYLRMARSLDGGRSFEPPVQIGGEAVEGAVASLGMTNLFSAPDGALYSSWLDSRESIAYVLANKKHPPKNIYASQLRVARSDDRGRSFQKSTLVTEPVCVCCGTKVAQGKDGPVYAGTRGLAWQAVKGSADPVRDIVVAASHDRGATWDAAVKLHDDGFKVSACPDVTAGLAVDSKGRLHAAWYTGSDRRPGVFYAVSSDRGKSFSEPVALLTDDWLPYGDVKLALDAKENVFVAFEDRRGDVDLIRLARIGADGSVLHAEPWPGTGPDLAAIGDAALIVWGGINPASEEQGGAVELATVRLEPGS